MSLLKTIDHNPTFASTHAVPVPERLIVCQECCHPPSQEHAHDL